MDNLLFLDTETTGKLEDGGRLVQLAFKVGMKKANMFFKPAVPISFEAMSVHHITNEDVADRPAFGGVEKEAVQALLDSNIMVAHNAVFDAEILRREGLEPKQIICTLKVAQRLFDFSMYKLQFLRYQLGLEMKEVRAHDAEGDIEVLEALFSYLLGYLQRESHGKPDSEILADMLKWTKEPVLLRRMPFGEHHGLTFDKVPRDYLQWVLDKANPDEDLKYTINCQMQKQGALL